MKFSTLVSFFERLEETASQIEMTAILAELFENASEEDIDTVCYMVLGNIAPGYAEVDLGLGDKTVISALALAAERDEEEVSRWVRDRGTLSARAADLEIPWKEEYRDYMAVENGLRVEDVHDGLMQIATASGSGSVRKKKAILAAMLAATDEKERYYITRLDLSDVHCRRARDAGVMLGISTDAHDTDHLRFLDLGVAVARRGWLETGDVINTRSLDDLRSWLEK